MTLEERIIEGLQNEGYTNIHTQSDKPNARYDEHKHDKETTHIVLRGSIEILCDGQTFLLQKGDRYDVPANALHEALVSEKGCTYVVGEK